jgi:ribosomal protein S18 acetylase RimI-like enzyme
MPQSYRAPPMPDLELLPFADEHLEDAAALLAERHARHRRAEPLLPQRFEDPREARDEIQAARTSDEASGAVAVRGGRLIGFVLGVRKSDEVWGANVWVDPAGHAVEQAEDVRDLYAAAAARWVEEGRTRHYVEAPAPDRELVDAWFRLGFGQQHARAIRELPEVTHPVEGVREAEEQDVDALVALAPLLGEHQALSPVFAGRPRPGEAEMRQEVLEDLASPQIGTLVAEVDGRIVGNVVVVPIEMSAMHTGLARPDGASFLAWAATLPDVRGTGAGLALTDAAFAWARARGYDTIVTDWRVTNLLSSRFWPRRGFRTTFLRLYRSIP